MVEEKNPIVQLHEYYYTKEELNPILTNKADKNHTHNTTTSMTEVEKDKFNNCDTYAIRLSDTDGATFDTKYFIMKIHDTNKLFASVKKNGKIIESGWILFLANGNVYAKEIDYQPDYHSYFAILNINWDIPNVYDIFASYVGDVKYNNGNKVYDQFTYCMDYCKVEMKE